MAICQSVPFSTRRVKARASEAKLLVWNSSRNRSCFHVRQRHSCVHLHRPGPVPTVPKYCLKGKGTSFLLSVLFAFISVEPHNSPCARPVVVSPSQLAGLATFCACRSRCIHTRYRSTPDWLLSASLCCRKLEMFEIEGRPHHLHRPCKTASIFTAFRKAHRAITILRQCINL